jgi:heme exporter protein A
MSVAMMRIMHNARCSRCFEDRSAALLEVSNLACERGERTLFSGLTFTVAPGTLLRVAGANGSGKTSLLRIVCGLMLQAAGEVRWKGGNTRTLREEYWQALIYIGHLNALKDDLTALENIEIGAALSGHRVTRDAALAALADLGIARCAELHSRVLSQGQRRRVALARLLVSRATPLWVLDEPFPGLDAAAVGLIGSTIARHVAEGGTVLLTTHQEVAIEAPAQRIDLGDAPS